MLLELSLQKPALGELNTSDKTLEKKRGPPRFQRAAPGDIFTDLYTRKMFIILYTVCPRRINTFGTGLVKKDFQLSFYIYFWLTYFEKYYLIYTLVNLIVKIIIDAMDHCC